jgi:hypothetical protein
MNAKVSRGLRGSIRVSAAAGMLLALAVTKPQGAAAYELNDSHFHLTNYIQQGTDIRAFLEMMGTRVGRVALFGIPLQQTWSYENSGDFAPTYYLETDAPLYYYSFTDAYIAMTYLSLQPEQRARFDPMITGFNPADMYAVDHIKRVLQLFPGVFSGIGEFSIHKEFVSSKVAGDVASLTDPALDRILEFAAEAGLLVILHNDIDMPFARPGEEPVYLSQTKALLRRHRGATIIWAHVGLGRVVRPAQTSPSAAPAERAPGHMARIVGAILEDPELAHVYFDISWDEVAKYLVATPETTRDSASIINRFPDRFLFGTDDVAPADAGSYLEVYRQYEPLWRALTPEAEAKVKRENYERLFDAARVQVRAWERANPR